MRNYYYENVAVEESRLVNCLNALCRLEERPFARLMTRAIQEAHTESVPPVAPDDFWKNLFVGARPLITPNKDRDPRTVPDAPYEYLDAQDAVKYLSDIGRNRKAADGTPITDSLVVLNYFHISDKPEQLRAYNDVLRKLMGDRNDWIGHVIEARDKKAGMKDATQYRDLLLQAVEPLCTTQWSGQQRSIALREKILREFYDNLGPMEYTLESIMRYAHIDLGKREQLEELLVAADFTLQDGRVTLEINPTIFADELTQVALRTDLSLESRARQLKLRLPGGEIIMHEMLLRETEGDLQHISQHALEELLERGEADAQCEMGWRWVEKKSGDHKENCRKAAPWFEKAAEQGHPQAMRVLGRWLLRGLYVKQDQRKGLLLLRMAADAGELKAHRFLGQAYEDGEGTEKDPERAYQMYEKGARLGSSVCQLEQARCLMNGIGVAENEEEAVYLYQKLDYQNMPKASWALAEYYKTKWCKTACFKIKGYEREMYCLEDYKNDAEYLHYLQRAVDGEIPAAMREKAALYANQGEEWLSWMQKAADAGDSKAQYEMGGYCEGKDLQEAFRWYLRAAQGGYTESYRKVGKCYLKGVGTPVHILEGRRWLHEAEKVYCNKESKLGSGVAAFMQNSGFHMLMPGESEIFKLLGHSYLAGSSPEEKEKGIAYLEKISGINRAQTALQYARQEKSLDTALFLYARAGDQGAANGYFEAGKICQKSGKLKDAFQYYYKASETVPEAAYRAATLLKRNESMAPKIQKLLHTAAQKDYAPAQFELFEIYSKGFFQIQEDMKQALEWLRKAADQEYAKACHQLGNLYADGKHVCKDIMLATDWLEKALKTPGYEHAERVKQSLDEIWKK